MKLLVKGINNGSYRLLDIEEKKEYRVFQRDFKEIEFIAGSLLDVDLSDDDIDGDLITNMTITSEIVGDQTKAKVKVDASIKLGSLIDGVPVLRLGPSWAEKGQKVRNAFFK